MYKAGVSDLEHKETPSIRLSPSIWSKRSPLPANLKAKASCLCSNPDAEKESVRRRHFCKEEIMFGGVHCTRLIIFLKT